MAKKKTPAKTATVERYLVAVSDENGQRLDRVEATTAFDEASFLKEYCKQAPKWLAERAVRAEVVTR